MLKCSHLLETRGKAVRKGEQKEVVTGTSLMRRVSRWSSSGPEMSPEESRSQQKALQWFRWLQVTPVPCHPRPRVPRGNGVREPAVPAARAGWGSRFPWLSCKQLGKRSALPSSRQSQGVRSCLWFVEWEEADDEVGREQLVLGTRIWKKSLISVNFTCFRGVE